MTEARGVIEYYLSVVVHGMYGHPNAAVMTDDFYEVLRTAGFAVVPVEPTAGMLLEGNLSLGKFSTASSVYQAMLKAAQGGADA